MSLGSIWMSSLFLVITQGQKSPNLQPPFLLIALIPTNQPSQNKAEGKKTVNLNYKRDKQSNQHRYVLMTNSTLLAKLLWYLINRKNILYVLDTLFCTNHTAISGVYYIHTHAPLHKVCPHYDFNDCTKELNMAIWNRISIPTLHNRLQFCIISHSGVIEQV